MRWDDQTQARLVARAEARSRRPYARLKAAYEAPVPLWVTGLIVLFLLVFVLVGGWAATLFFLGN